MRVSKGLQVSFLLVSFVSGDTVAAPESLTVHSLERLAVIIKYKYEKYIIISFSSYDLQLQKKRMCYR